MIPAIAGIAKTGVGGSGPKRSPAKKPSFGCCGSAASSRNTPRRILVGSTNTPWWSTACGSHDRRWSCFGTGKFKIFSAKPSTIATRRPSVGAIERFMKENPDLGDRLQQESVSVRRELSEFAPLFVTVARRTRTPAQVLAAWDVRSLQKQLTEIHDRLERLHFLAAGATPRDYTWSDYFACEVEGEERKAIAPYKLISQPQKIAEKHQHC